MKSDHFEVAEKSILLINNDKFGELIKLNDEYLKGIVDSLFINAKTHWNATILGLSVNSI